MTQVLDPLSELPKLLARVLKLRGHVSLCVTNVPELLPERCYPARFRVQFISLRARLRY